MVFLYRIFLFLLLAGALLADVTLVIMMNWSAGVFWLLAAMILPVWLGSFKQKYFAAALSAFFVAVLAFFVFITPEEQFKGVKWEASCSEIPEIIIDGDKAVISNLRDFKYRSEDDFDVRYINQEYDLNKLESLDLILSHWDGMDNIAHTLFCFNFSDGQTAVLSVEMRCPEGTSRAYYTTFFKQHGLIYIWGTKEDLVDLRSRYRIVESLYRYRTTATAAEARQLFTLLAGRTNQLYSNWEFYRTIQGNCTTEILPYLKEVRRDLHWDLRALINGSLDRMLFEQGFLAHRPGEEFESLRARSFVPGRASGNE